MSTPPGEYYTDERWQNWLDRIENEGIDPEDEDSARLLLNLQDDAAIAVAKILTDYDDGELDEETALSELAGVREIVLDEIAMDDEETLMLIDGVQTSLVCVFYAAEEYTADGVAEEATVTEEGGEEYLDGPTLSPWTYVYRRGSNVSAGETLFAAGERLSAKDTILLRDLGHESIETTQKYLKANNEELKQAWRQKGPSF